MADKSSGRPNQTAADYVTLVLSPVLIMGLVDSLVLFLLEVFYNTDGQWRERLQWILTAFVIGAVLSARISMNGAIAGRAPLYGAVLAILIYIGMQSFVEYPDGLKEMSFLINMLLVGIVSWCAYRLTWDCTNVDEETDMSGEGLLQAAGFDENPAKAKEASVEEAEEAKRIDPPKSWWQRYQRDREQKQKKRTLGVWVVYFSLAALPLFGLGQSFIPLTAPGRRQFAFWLMTIYVGCGLGLLLTTCFLGLRRYLRQKRLQMPAAMTGTWLTVGGSLVVLLLLVGAFLPRPYAEYPVMGMFDPAGSAKRGANRFAFKGDSPGKGQGQPGAAQPDGKAPGGKAGEQGQGKGQGEGDKDGKGDGKDGQGKDGQGKDGQGKDGQGKDGQSKDGQSKDGQGKSDSSGKGDKGEQDKGGKDGKGEKSGQGEKNNQGGRSGGGNTAKGMKNMEHQGQQAPASSSSSRTARLQQFLSKVGPILKWIVFAVLAIIVLLALLRGGLGFLANFTEWARRLLDAWRNFWANLFGRPRSEATNPEAAATEVVVKERQVPFSAFSNPFDNGEAHRMTLRALALYTFAALEAWARERDLGRRTDETAFEFVQRLADEVPALEKDAQRLANLHARAEYTRERLPDNTLEILQAFWERLERVVEAPMSA